MEGVSKVDFGKRGEELAGKMMLAKGYRILERNYRWSHLEIDLIAVHDNKLIFAEVKTRTSSFLGEPYVAVNKAKQRLLIKAANAYILKNNCDLEIVQLYF